MRTTLRCIGLLFVALALGLPASADFNNLVVNGGFETGNFEGWTLSGDVQGAHVTTLDPHSGQFSALFNPQSDFVYISQDIPTTEGVRYNLIHWLQIHDKPPLEFQIFWNGVQIGDFLDPEPSPWKEFEFGNLLATGPETELKFGFMVSDPTSYFQLDDVSVTAVPEPGTILMLGSGILGMAGMLRRKLIP